MMKRSVFSLLLAAAMIFSTVPVSAYATEGLQDGVAAIGTSGLCEHHTEHDDSCGYAPAAEESPCGYVCGACAASDEVCTCGAAEGEAHTEGCDLYEAPAEPDCTCGVAEGEAHTEACALYQAPAEPVCICGTDNPAHATNCPAYAAPESPECCCVEKCTEDNVNVWCDVCGVQGAAACKGGEDSAAVYGNQSSYDVSQGSVTIDDSCGSSCPGHTITGTTSSNTITVSGGAHNIILSGVTITVASVDYGCPLDLSNAGATTVTMAEGTTNTFGAGLERPGVYVPYGSKVTFTGTGMLISYGATHWPGIGRNGGGGDIQIENGTIKAVGGGWAAGIGGSNGQVGGTITINGGNVEAIGSGAAGIGGGPSKSGGTITINGGNVTATCNDGGGAGIGGGKDGVAGTVIITGGNITAKGNSAGIGNGGYEGLDDSISIQGGTMEVFGGFGPAPTVAETYTTAKLWYGDNVSSANANGVKDIAELTNDDNYEKKYIRIAPNFTITFDTNGGRFTSGAGIAAYATNMEGKLTGLPENPSCTEHHFAGWFDARTGGNEISIETVFTDNQTVYAQWKAYEDAFSISYLGNYNNFDFGTETYGYSAMDGRIMMITNTGDYDLTLTLPDETDNFDVYYFCLTTEINLIDTDTYTIVRDDAMYIAIAPKEGLGASDTAYTKTLNIAMQGGTNEALSQTITASFQVNRADQTITAGEVTATYGDSGLQVNASADGGGALSYAVTDGDAVSVDANGNLTTLKAGSATVTVTAAKTSNYAEATKTVSVTINKKAVTAAPKAVSAYVNGTAALELVYTGLVGSDTITPNGAELKLYESDGTEISVADAVATAGTYTIKWINYDTATFTGAENYDVITSETASFVVLPLSEDPSHIHSFGEWKVIKEATTTTNGSKERSCAGCGYTEKATIWATNIPQTGDNSQMGLWLSLIGVSLAGLLTMLHLWKRRIAQGKE